MNGSVEDARGRVLTLRPLTMLDRLRLFKALGPELSMNDAYLGVASLAASVSAIDGVPLPFPASEAAAAALQPEDADTVKALAGN